MYQFPKSLWLILIGISFSISTFGQQITAGQMTTLNTTYTVNTFYNSYIFEDNIVLLADCQNEGQLDVLIIVLNQKKEVIHEQIIGTNLAYERPIELFEEEGSYWLGMNSVRYGEKAFKLVELNKDFTPKNYQSIPIQNLDQVTAMKYDAYHQQLIFTALVSDDKQNMFPKLIRYDLTEHHTISELALSGRTDQDLPLIREDSIPDKYIKMENNFIKVLSYKKETVKRYVATSKECFQIKCMNNTCSALLLVGQESSTNFTDFWVARINDNTMVWESIYKTRRGGDLGKDIFWNQSSKQIMVGGLGYNKTEREMYDFNYHYRVLQLDEKGKLLKKYAYKSEGNTRTWYSKMQPLGDNYIITGRTEDVKIKSTGDNFSLSNLHLSIVDKEGVLKTDQAIESQTLDVLHSTIVLSANKLWLIYSSRENESVMKVLEVSISG